MTPDPDIGSVVVQLQREDGTVWKRSRLSGHAIDIGTGAGCAIRILHDPMVRHLHARLFLYAGVVLLVSEPGQVVCVNGCFVQAQPIVEGDLVQIGQLRFSVVVPSEEWEEDDIMTEAFSIVTEPFLREKWRSRQEALQTMEEPTGEAEEAASSSAPAALLISVGVRGLIG